MRLAHCIVALALPVLAGGCSTYLDDLNRAEAHSAANEQERALALFRLNESDIDSLSHVDHTRYCYLRGMGDYRLGKAFRADARHWLALAKALEDKQPGGLKPEWKDRLEKALDELNQEVWRTGKTGEGAEEDAKTSEDAKDKPKDDESEGKKPGKKTED